MPYHLLMDLILLVIMALAAFQGWKRGFILTFCSFLAIFVAFFGAGFLSDHLCEPLGRLIQPALDSALTQQLQRELGQPEFFQFPSPQPEERVPDHAQEESSDPEPSFTLEQALEALEQNPWLAGIVQSIRQTFLQEKQQAVGNAVTVISSYLAREIARIFLFFLGFLLVMILWWLFSHALDLAFRLPVLSTINAMSGLALGLLKGALLISIAVWLLEGHLFSPDLLEKTVILRFFSAHSPLALLVGLLGAVFSQFITSS